MYNVNYIMYYLPILHLYHSIPEAIHVLTTYIKDTHRLPVRISMRVGGDTSPPCPAPPAVSRRHARPRTVFMRPSRSRDAIVGARHRVGWQELELRRSTNQCTLCRTRFCHTRYDKYWLGGRSIMAEAKIQLRDGATVDVRGTPEEVARIVGILE